MYKKLFILLLLLIILSVFCKKNSTGPEPEGPWGWAKQFEGGYSTILYSVQQTNDGGFITVGRNGNPSVWLIKTDNNGDTLWTRTYGGDSWDFGYSVQQTTDGGYIVAGETSSYGAGGHDVYLIKTNGLGDTLWTRTFGGEYFDCGNSVQQTTDGGYIIAGQTESYGAGSYDVYLIKTNALGDALWTRTYGGTGDDFGWSVQQTTDGGYIVVGRTHAPKENFALYMIKTDSEGDTIWTKTYAEGVGVGYYVVQTTDGGYIVVGSTNYQAGDSDAWLLKTDSLGDTLWVKTYGGSGYDLGYSVQQTTDGGYIITGENTSYGTSGTGDVWLIKTDTAGISQWSWTYSTQISNDRGMEVQQTAEGDFIVAGFREFWGSAAKGILIRKY